MIIYDISPNGLPSCKLMYFDGATGQYSCPRTEKPCVGHRDVLKINNESLIIGLNQIAMSRCPTRITSIDEALEFLRNEDSTA